MTDKLDLYEFILQALRLISSTAPSSLSLIQTDCLLSCITRCVPVLPNYVLNMTKYLRHDYNIYNGDVTVICHRLVMLHPL